MPENREHKSKNIKSLTIDLLKSEYLFPGFLEEQFEANRLLFLLDGLDEVTNETVRGEVIQWIQNQHIRKNSLVVTSRFSGLHEAKGLKFHDAIPVFVVQDFDIADIERFLENWYKNIELAVVGEEGEKDKVQAVEKGKSRYEDLMHIIKDENYEKLRQLAVNPLLLTIIAIVHRTRAVLPKERHKLYEECLKVMIELWNVANRKIEITFSVENSIDNLSKIAVVLMEKNRRELDLPGIKTLLPQEIEGQTLDSFIKEMVLKTGLLYESEGKLGFLNRAFQEYLAAYYYVINEDRNKILEHRDEDNWLETFKLFVNIGNYRVFFDEIISNLFDFEKDYWRHMRLWNECLNSLVYNDARKEIETQFVKKIRQFIQGIDEDKWNNFPAADLLVHFSNLTQKELKTFQYNKPEFIAGELSRGNFKVLGEPSITPETLDNAEKYVEFNINTIEKLLQFKINFENQKQNILPLRAFLVLKRADYKKLKELVLDIIQSHEDEVMRLNALYVFKKIN